MSVQLMVFSLIACIAYTLAYYFDWSLFQYYLEENRFHFAVQPTPSGPPTRWWPTNSAPLVTRAKTNSAVTSP